MDIAYRKLKIAPLLALGTLFLSACGGDITSENIGELKAYWVVDANRQTQEVKVLGRVIEAELEESRSDSFFGTIINAVLFAQTPSDNDRFFEATGFVRLTGGDVMRASTSNASHQLYRRIVPLEYQTTFPFNPADNVYELRLDYNKLRFPSSVTSATVFDVSNVPMAEPDTIVSVNDEITLSWNLGSTNTSADTLFYPIVAVNLLGCASGDIPPVTEEIVLDPVVAGPVNVSIANNQLPAPVYANGSSPALTASPGLCRYGFQILATTYTNAFPPGAETDIDNPPIISSEIDTEPEVLIISRSIEQVVRVANGPEVSQ